jgi:hypothetical protein
MWARNLLFAGFVAGGLATYVVSLAPSSPQPGATALRPDLSPREREGFQQVVAAIDAAFERQWREQNLEPAERAPDLQIARRLSLALAGTVPSLEEIRRFELQPSEGRLAWWTSYLLADRRASDYLAERLARAYVGVADGPFLIYRRRRFATWLAEQLQANRPYDQLARELIAGDGLWTNNPATNFITATVKPGQEQGPDESALAARVARAFLGIRLDCAECHDHPFENWKQEEFRSLAAFFGKTEQTLTGIRDARRGEFKIEDRTTGEELAIEPAVPFQPELLPDRGTPRERLAVWVTHRENQAFARAFANRAWALMFGQALVEPVDNLRTDEVPEPLDLLARDFVQHGYNVQRMFQVIAATRAFQLDSRAPVDADGEPLPGRELSEAHEEAWAVFPLARLRPEQVVGGMLQAASLSTIDYDSHILIRFARTIGQSEFIKRYGDFGEDELQQQGGTIPQRLLMMNGELIKERTKDNLLANASTRIALLAPTDERAVETAYLATLTRRPTEAEARYFVGRLRGIKGADRSREMEDLYWELLNATEFSWNH